MSTILVYTKSINPRIEYALKIVFRVVLGIDFSIILKKEEFIGQQGIKINYSEEEVPSSLQVMPCGLLNENTIHPQTINVSSWNELPIIFQTNNPQVPFDLFSAVFYLVTRYEEYLPFETDQHGRFEAGKSVAARENFLRIPIVDLWCIALAKQLGIADRCSNIQSNNYSFKVTVDVDVPWSFRNKGLVYSVGSVLRDLFTGRFRNCVHRISVITGLRNDPGDNYKLLEQTEKRIGHSIRYFILCRKYDTNHKNLSIGRSSFHKLLEQLDRKKKVSIHPSFASSENSALLKEEIDYLSGVLDRKIDASRQHYLRLFFPGTYQKLIEHGILADFSMGYASQTGFRAGIARSFNYYDLSTEQETRLRIYPFQVMDRTLLSYLKLSPEAAVQEFDYYTNIIRSVGGEFICLWHNDSLCDYGEWKGWRKVFENTIEMNEYI